MLSKFTKFKLIKPQTKLLQDRKYYSTAKFNYFTTNKSFKKAFLFTSRKHFSETNDKRYDYNYEAPEQQEINFKTIGFKFLKFILIVLLGFNVLKWLLFMKYNKVSKTYQVYFINELFEMKLADFVSHKLQKVLEHQIYKTNSEEGALVYKIYKKLLEGNKISLNITQENVFLIDSISYGAFMNKNGDLFISNKLIELANNNEDEVAFFLAIELVSNFTGKFFERVLKYFLLEKVLPDYDVTKMRLRSFSSHYIDKLNKYNRFLYFYPESNISNYYEEMNMISLALKLLKQGGFNVFQSVEILQKFEERMKYYPRKYNELLFVDRDSRFYQPTKNMLKIYLI